MNIQDGIKLLLQTNDSAGWGQMSRRELIDFAISRNIDDTTMFADACHEFGIGELAEGEAAGPVIIKFERPVGTIHEQQMKELEAKFQAERERKAQLEEDMKSL